MVLWLRVFTAFSEDPSSVLRTHIRWLTTCQYPHPSGVLRPLASASKGVYSHECAHTPTHPQEAYFKTAFKAAHQSERSRLSAQFPSVFGPG